MVTLIQHDYLTYWHFAEWPHRTEDSEKWVKWPISMRSVIHSQENKTMTFIRDIVVKQEDLYVQLDPQCLGRWWWWCTWRGSGWAPELLVDKNNLNSSQWNSKVMKLPISTDYRRSKWERNIIGRPRKDDVTWLCVRAAFVDRAINLFLTDWCVGSWGYPSASAGNLLASKYTSWLLLCC